MAPRQTATSEQRPLLREDVKTVDDHKAFMDKADSMTTVQKLMLNAALWGNDASCNFSYQYTLPVLQTLGLPLSLVSIDSAIGGPTATLLLPLLGWFTDQGPNPRRRKLITTISLCGVVVLSMLCIIPANLLHLSYLMEQGVNRTAHLSPPANLSDPFTKVHSTSSGDWEGTETTRSHELYKSETASDLRSGLMPLTNDSLANPNQRSWHEEIYQIPIKAGLGLLGFILLDIGFDASNGCIKTCVLTYAPRAEHTSLLVLGLIIQSAGGISTSAFGLVDFTSMLGLSHIEGARLAIQTTVQAAIIIIFLTTGLLIAVVTIRRLHKTHSYVFEDRQPDSGPCLSEEASIRREEYLSQSAALDGFQNSILSSGSVRYDPSLALLEEHRHSSVENPNYPDAPLECTSLLEAGQGSKEYRRGLNRSEISSRSVLCGEGNSLCSIPGHLEAKRTSVDDIAEYFIEQKTAEAMDEYLLEEKFVKDVPALDKAQTDTKSCCKKGFKVKIFLVILSTYFSTADQFLFLMTSSDFVGKAIYEGDPDAPPDSQSLSRYQDGVRVASVGFFVYYIGFLVCSFVQPRILPLLGYRLEYAALHLLMCVTLVALSLTELLEVYFVLAALAGVKRACVQSIPFAITNDLIQSKASERADGKNHMGLAFSMVSAAMPLSYCTVFSWIGPLEDLTGVVAAPFLVACLTTVLATCSFLAVGKV